MHSQRSSSRRLAGDDIGEDALPCFWTARPGTCKMIERLGVTSSGSAAASASAINSHCPSAARTRSFTARAAPSIAACASEIADPQATTNHIAHMAAATD